jgi:hypothetical protein
MHASALVIVPADMADDIPSAVEALMAPHREVWDPATEEYDGFWDWYRIGGRWDGQILGLDALDVDPDGTWNYEVHYSDAVSDPARNSVDAIHAAEFATYTVVSPNGYAHREVWNPDWDGVDHSAFMVDNPDFHEWRAKQLMAYRDGVAVVVDYHF